MMTAPAPRIRAAISPSLAGIGFFRRRPGAVKVRGDDRIQGRILLRNLTEVQVE
jgi:hypothetical protein